MIFADDTPVFTLELISAPTDKIVKVRLQGITVRDGIDVPGNLGIIGITGSS